MGYSCIVNLHGGSGGASTAAANPSTSETSDSSRLGSSKRYRSTHQNDSDNDLDGRPPKKRGRPSSHHASNPCGPCTVWLQSGRNASVASHHLSSPMRHPGQDAEMMSAYVSISGVHITLESDSAPDVIWTSYVIVMNILTFSLVGKGY